MAIKVKAVERKLKFTKNENDPGVYRYVLGAELYTALNQKKVIREAALRSGVSQGVMQACWDAAGEVIKAWATEGHSVALPGLGTMRFGVRAKAFKAFNELYKRKTEVQSSSSDPWRTWVVAARGEKDGAVAIAHTGEKEAPLELDLGGRAIRECRMTDEAGTPVTVFSAVGGNESLWGVRYAE